ncbi:MAG: O-antigen ligase family protein [Patescibacteria group bacterium]
MNNKLLNPIFVFHLIFVGAVLIGIIPRELVLYETGLLIIYFLLASAEDGLIFFIRSIPLFIAIPLTSNYDNLNQWRILAIILFCKWLFSRQTWHYISAGMILLYKKPLEFLKDHSWAVILHLLLLLSLASLWHAPDRIEGLKRIIYFLNAALIGVVIVYPPRSKIFFSRLIKNITIPIVIVTIVGVIQVVSTYVIDIYQFMRIWGEGIQMREFGTQWSYIATHVGNTWFAYFGEQLSLRVFSLFPDSHSFPIFLLLGLPVFFAWTLIKPLEKASRFRDMLFTRGKIAVLWIPLVFLMMILSGTRGIWAGAIAMVFWSIIVLIYMRYTRARQEIINIFKYLLCHLFTFFLLFAVAYPIFVSPQFLVSKADGLLLERRLRSILDFGETSNSQRIDIWKKSLVSIQHHPMLGIGIGNFPVVLGQDIKLSKAGSSAHNIYLQVASEMGIPSLLAFLCLLCLVLKRIYDRFVKARESIYQAYFGGLLITLPWVMAYLMTDVAVFDERALLLCIATLAIVAAPSQVHD